MLARSHLVPAAAAVLLLAACAGGQKPSGPQAEAGKTAPAIELTEPQVVGILAAANDVDVAAGQQAESNASAAPVQAFGRQMIADHTALNGKGAELAAKLGLAAEESPTSKRIRDDGVKAYTLRSSLTGETFDKAYLDDEIAFHVAVLQTIDEALLPNARNPELQALITAARPQIAAHLEQARTLRKSLGP